MLHLISPVLSIRFKPAFDWLGVNGLIIKGVTIHAVIRNLGLGLQEWPPHLILHLDFLHQGFQEGQGITGRLEHLITFGCFVKSDASTALWDD